jgi:hypothetical protein
MYGASLIADSFDGSEQAGCETNPHGCRHWCKLRESLQMAVRIYHSTSLDIDHARRLL